MSDNNQDGLIKSTFVTQTHGYIDVSLKQDIWQKVADDFKGIFKVSHNSGNELEMLSLAIPYKHWVIKLSESDTKPLKFEIDFTCLLDYELVLGPEDSIDKLLKKFGKKEIEIGNTAFDSQYLIDSKDHHNTTQIFTAEIVEYLLKHNVYSISYSTNLKKRTSHLISVVNRVTADRNSMDDLIHLYMKIIDRLEVLKIVDSKG